MNKPKEKLKICLRHFCLHYPNDLPDVVKIETKCFEFPWLEDDFTKFMRELVNCATVAEYENKVIGFMFYELHKEYIHLINFAVSPEYWRQGVGSQMVAKLITKLSTKRRKILLEICETNLPAQWFFSFCGFRAIDVLHNFYCDTSKDAYLMQFLYCQETMPTFQGRNRIKNFFGSATI